MVDLLFGLDLLDPALGQEPAVNLLNGLEAQKEKLSTLLHVANLQLDEPFRGAASIVRVLISSIVTWVGGGRCDRGARSPSFRVSRERIGDTRSLWLNCRPQW